ASFIAAGIDTGHAVGTLQSGLAGDLQLDLGNGASADTLRATVQMTLASGMRLADVSGDDFWVTEGGGPNLPEAFMARVSTDNAATWSGWEYRFSEVQYNPDGNQTIAFFTGFDFVNDFGLPTTATVTHIELQNAIAADRVDSSSGEGTIVLGGGSGFLLNKGPQGANAGYASGNFDADIGYVFYAQSIPEPSAMALVALGCLALRARRRHALAHA
ncbi:MAG TPA: PEP-CTERM sorting domain-containing protein, partial [Chthoniobacteraceae bacterium]|nr:PEP-CTERM sorting domain-containing protein [Chthoniobacteraceae bacterium]